MSYSSRVYRQRNAHAHDENKQKAFFSGQHELKKPAKKNKAVQAKLAVNKPGDSYEQEADAVASTLVNQESKTPVVQQKKISGIQRLSTPASEEQLSTNDARMKNDKDIQEKRIQTKGEEVEKREEDQAVQKMDEPKKEEEDKGVQKMDEPKKEEEDKGVQKMDEPKKEEEDKAVQKMDEPKKEEEDKAIQKMEGTGKEEEDKDVQKSETPEKDEEDKAIQKKSASQTGGKTQGIASYLDQSTGKGKPLPAKTLNEMGSGFGVDFSNVRIHNDQDAAAANKELDAQAFTHGQDVYFNEGKFDPETSAGKFLLAHELTHVVQQSQGKDQKGVKRQAATPAATQQVANISTPVPAGLQPSAQGEYETIINGAKVIIRKDITTRKMGRKAETKFSQSGGRISFRTRNGEIESFTGPGQIIVAIQTFYQRNARAADPSGYGRGTTEKDIEAKDTTLGFHEGSHGTDYIHYITTNALPVFKGSVGMKTKEFEAHMQTYSEEMKMYFTNMSKTSIKETDCTGTTIDQLTGSNICIP
jgi:hypothetical protein